MRDMTTIRLHDSGYLELGERYYTGYDTETNEDVIVLATVLRNKFGLHGENSTEDWMMAADFDGFRKEWIYEAPVTLPRTEFGIW